MVFEEIRSGGCCSYVVACGDTCAGVVIDPELSQIDRTLALIGKAGVRIHYVIDTHTHADHFSASRELARRLGVPRVMHRSSVAPDVDVRVDDGETLIAGHMRIRTVTTLPANSDGWTDLTPNAASAHYRIRATRQDPRTGAVTHSRPSEAVRAN